MATHEPHSPEAQDPLTALFGPPIYIYSRAQALEDGVLVDVTEQAHEQGFLYPVALTASVWALVETIPALFAWQDIPGRLSDVLFMARQRIRRCQPHDMELLFKAFERWTVEALEQRQRQEPGAEGPETVADGWHDAEGLDAEDSAVCSNARTLERSNASLLLATIENTTQREDESTIEDKVVTLKIVVGPGDAGEPVLTVMLPDED